MQISCTVYPYVNDYRSSTLVSDALVHAWGRTWQLDQQEVDEFLARVRVKRADRRDEKTLRDDTKPSQDAETDDFLDNTMSLH